MERRGITLIEALFVLGIMAILIGMVMVLYAQTNDSNKYNQFIQEIFLISNITHQIYKDTPNYNGISTQIIIASGLLPKKYIKDNQSIVTPFGTNITSIDYDTDPTFSGNSGSAFDINIDNIPQTACSKLSSNSFGDSLAGIYIQTMNIMGGGPSNVVNLCASGNYRW